MINMNELANTLEKERMVLCNLSVELNSLPKDRLHIRRCKGHLRYCTNLPGAKGSHAEHYLHVTSNEQIAPYLRARYLRRLIPALSFEIRTLENFVARYKPENKCMAWDIVPDEYKEYIKNEFPSNKVICEEWAIAPFESNPYDNAAGNTYLTKYNQAVRSRIELISADILFDMALFCRYECKLHLKDGDIFPDFMVIHPRTLEIYYVEIFGMMDRPEYAASAFKKIHRYAENGLSSHLICFFDHKDAPLSTSEIRTTFELYFK